MYGTVLPEPAFTIEDKGLFPEGIAYDSKTKRFFLSSLSKFKIISIDKSGRQADFIQAHQDSMLRCVSLKIDEKSRSLWAVSNSDWGDSVISAIHIYDIDKKQLIYRFFTQKGESVVFNDIALGQDNESFVIDYEGNSIYHIIPEMNKVELLIKSDNFLSGANGMCISPDNTTLFVSTSSTGIIIIDLITRKIRTIENPLAVDINGIDGLVLYKNSLIGVMCKDETSAEPMIIRYQLNLGGNQILGATILDRKNPGFATPTNGVMVGDVFYCLAATYLQLFSLNENENDEKLGNPLIFKYRLKEK